MVDMIVNANGNPQPYTWAEMSERFKWSLVIYLAFYHVACIASLGIYAFGLMSTPIKMWTVVWVFVVGYVSLIGATAGVHRLWAHRAYKANLPLRIILMILYTTAGMNPLYYWVRDHRIHHKYVDTDADPHNSDRGFVFSHIAWLVMKRHPESLEKNREIDMSDIHADKVAMFQTKYAAPLRLLLCFFIPTVIPVIVWKETILHSVLTQCFIRYTIAMNCVWTINSVAHLWGSRPYDRSIKPTDNILVSMISIGEGSHNYHHTFPWDYKTSEFPYFNFNSVTLFIDAFAKIGWAYDRRKASPNFIERVARCRTYKSELKDM